MRTLLSITMIFWASLSFAQIEISEETQEVEDVILPLDTRYTEAYFHANWSSTSRKLIENDAPFGDTLGNRIFEGKLNRWSYGVGFRSRLNDYLSWEGGISLLRNGESYLYEAADTMYSYNTTYIYIGMPIKVMFTYGQQIRVYAGGGILPQMFVQYRQDQEWLTTLDYREKNTITANNGYNSFVFSLVFNAGVQMDITKNMAMYVMPEFRYQLTSSYEKQDDFKHYGRALGLNLGLTYKL
ncbi:MAG: outer membrane beta-barrel protein [Crocinitomicaceae bacterium]